MVINETQKACILYAYGSIENFLKSFSKKFYTGEQLNSMYLEKFADLTDDLNLTEEELDDMRDEAIESLACIMTKRMFNNNQEMIPYLVRYLYETV